MRRLISRRIFLTLAGIFVSGCASPNAAPPTDEGLTRFPRNERKLAPTIRGVTLGDDVMFSSEVSLQRGRVLLVNIWASWCGPCNEEAPELVGAFTKVGSIADFVGLVEKDNAPSAQAFARVHKISYPNVLDQDASILMDFNGLVPLAAIPSTIVIDARGRIAARVIGSVTQRTIVGLIHDIASEG